MNRDASPLSALGNVLSRLHRFVLAALLMVFGAQSFAINAPQSATLGECAKLCPEMRLVALNGADPAYRVYVSIHPVTFAQWKHCVRGGGCNGYMPEQQGVPDTSPVMNISFDDAQRYVAWLSSLSGNRYRLVYEDEWPQVVLGSRTTLYAWGDALGRNNANCLDCGSRWDAISVSPVASFKANDAGLYDTSGNVAHWVAARESSLATQSSACGTKPHYAAIVGSSWADPAFFMKTSEYTCFPKILRDDTFGFRVVSERRMGLEKADKAKSRLNRQLGR
jgi:Sulfatase-modifying factor enzyme 1